MEAMIVFRAVQGLGGGAIYALSFIVIGVIFPAEQRAKMQGIISGIWGLASILGPLAGGRHCRELELALDLLHQPAADRNRHDTHRRRLERRSRPRAGAATRCRRRIHADRRLAVIILRPGAKRSRAPPAKRRNLELHRRWLADFNRFLFHRAARRRTDLAGRSISHRLVQIVRRRRHDLGHGRVRRDQLHAAVPPGGDRPDRHGHRSGYFDSKHGLDRRQFARRPVDQPVRLSLRRGDRHEFARYRLRHLRRAAV